MIPNGARVKLTSQSYEKSSYFGPPAWSSGDPADLSVADSTAEPITALLLLHNDATLRAMHRLSRINKSLCE